MSAPAHAFWLQWVEDAFPDLDSRAYFLPPVYFNRVPMTRQSFAYQIFLLLESASGQKGLPCQPSIIPTAAPQGSTPQPPRVQDSDVRDDAAVQRIFVCLQKMAEKNKEVFVGMTQLQFGDYLCEPSYAAAAAQLPLPSNLSRSLPKNWKEGDFDFLVIHRQYGLIACEVKAVGDNVKALNMSQQDVDKNIRKKLTQAVKQLDKAEAMLSHLVSDVATGLRITKTIAVPNLTAHQIQQAIYGDSKLIQDLCRCLGTTDPADIAGLCLCSDLLSDPKPWDISSDKLMELENWWQRRVAGAGPDSHMTSALYKTLVARPKEILFFVFAKLLKSHHRIHLWAANCYHQGAPPGIQVEIFNRPLRSPPVVVREVKQDREIIKDGFVKEYRERGVPDQTDGPPVKRVYHRGEGHSGDGPDDCVTCGHEVATFLHSLRPSTPVAGVTTKDSPPPLNWKDMLVVSGEDLQEDSGVVKGLREKGILVQIMRAKDSEDVGTRLSDVVWVASGMRVSGLERKVVVCLDIVNLKSDNTANSFRLHLMSRCSSQLVIVSGKDEAPELCP